MRHVRKQPQGEEAGHTAILNVSLVNKVVLGAGVQHQNNVTCIYLVIRVQKVEVTFLEIRYYGFLKHSSKLTPKHPKKKSLGKKWPRSFEVAWKRISSFSPCTGTIRRRFSNSLPERIKRSLEGFQTTMVLN